MNRYEGSSRRNQLILALRAQYIVQDSEEIAFRLVEKVVLQEYAKDSLIITQNSSDNDLIFILSGRVAIQVHNREIAFRTAGTHVGEMAMIDPRARRSASVVAVEPTTVVASIKADDFRDIANAFPVLWRRIAVELGDRLRQRNQYVRPPNSVPVLFIGSSKEALPILTSLIDELKKSENLVLLPWIADIFWPSNGTMEDLEAQLLKADFAILVFGPDDEITSRGTTSAGPRDNVILECCMFFGAIGRKRTYFLKPKNAVVKLPSDLFGLKPIDYEFDATLKNIDISYATQEILRCIKHYGVK